MWPVFQFAQEISYRHFTPNDGLASSEVYDVHQDAKGYIWFATDRGLNRFDGYNFQVFTVKDGMGDNVVFTISEDKKGVLWFTTFSKGVYCYSYEKGFYPAAFNNSVLKLTRNTTWVQQLVFDAEGRPWFTLKDHLNDVFYYVSGDSVKEYKVAGVGPRETTILSVNRQALAQKLIVPVGDTIKLVKNRGNEYIFRLPTQDIMVTAILTNGDIIFAVENKLIISNKKRIKKIIHTPAKILSINYRAGDTVWVLTANGAYIYNLEMPGQPVAHYLAGKNVNGFLQDTEGNYWFTTLDNGVYMAPSMEFKIFSGLEGRISELQSFAGRLFVANIAKQAFTINNTFEVAPIRYTQKKERELLGKLGGRQLLFNYFLIDNKGTVTTNAINSRTKSWAPLKNGFALGYTDGFEYGTNNRPSFHSKQINFNLRVISICGDDSARLWLGTLYGLYSFSIRENTLGDIILPHRINTLVYDNTRQTLLAGTAGEGLFLITGNGKKNITETNGLAGNYVNTLLLQDTVLWVGTNKGFSRIILGPVGKIKSIDSYTTHDGLLSNEVNHFAIYNNLLWIATNNGLVYVNPARLKKRKQGPLSIYFTAIQVNDAPYDWKGQSLNLDYNQRTVTINYSNIAFANPGGTFYLYKLEGLHTDWIETRQKSVKFVNLPPGKYTFHITSGSGPGALAQSSPIKISIHIARHYTQTWWFIALCAVGILGVIVLVIYLYVRNHKRKLALQRKIVQAEQTALRAQMNPHFIFNALNSVQYYITENDKRSAGIFLSKFSGLIRSILDNSGRSTITLEEEIDCLQKYLELEHIRFGNKFNYEILVDKNISPSGIKIPAMLIQPFLENAIWHGLAPKEGEGRLLLSIHLKGDTIICHIEDNGIGREKAMQMQKNRHGHTSAAIKNIRERINLITLLSGKQINFWMEDLFNEDNTPAGTRVSLHFQIQN